MASNALPIIEEFLRAGAPQQRKNALTALTVIGDAASVRMLAQAALGDDDAGVRAHALKEIAALDREKAAAVSVFERELQSSDRAKQVRAYVVLGQLKSLGAYETTIELTWMRRLFLAAALYKHLYLVKNWEFRLRSWRAALLGSLAGSLLLIPLTLRVYLSTIIESREIIYYVIGLLLIVGAGTVMSMIASQRTTPINLHISRFAAVPAEVLIAVVLGFAGTIGYYAVVSALLLLPITKNIQTIGFMVLAGVMAGVVRAATAMTFGLYFSPKGNWLAEALAGTTAGFVLITLMVFVSYSFGGMTHVEARYVAAGSIPFAMGCASAFASIDMASPPARSRPGRSGFLLRLLFFPAVIALGLAVGFTLKLVTD